MKSVIASLLISLLSVAAMAASEATADVELSPAGSFKAKTSEVTGEAVMVGDTITAQNIVVKLKGLKTGIALRDKHATEKYLEVGKFPDAVLTSATGSGGKGKGKLKIRGIEKDVEGTYKVSGNELTATFPIKLSDYGINGVKYMGVGVSNSVNLAVTVPIKKK